MLQATPEKIKWKGSLLQNSNCPAKLKKICWSKTAEARDKCREPNKQLSICKNLRFVQEAADVKKAQDKVGSRDSLIEYITEQSNKLLWKLDEGESRGPQA